LFNSVLGQVMLGSFSKRVQRSPGGSLHVMTKVKLEDICSGPEGWRAPQVKPAATSPFSAVYFSVEEVV